jgi:GlpG protein
MRIIGHLPNEANATTFGDFLSVEGIENEIESEKEGWAIWIRSEDEWPRARDLLAEFLANPQDPRFSGKSERARKLRQEAVADAEAVRERTYDRRAVFRGTMPYGVGALTTVLISLCVGIAILAWTGYREKIRAELLITNISDTNIPVPGLHEIGDGEFWRLITPAFVHMDPLHLLFNMMMLVSMGSMVEARLGTGLFGLKVIALAVVSNLAQNYAVGPLFYGFSGVNYGLFGYIWVRGRLDPHSGLGLPPQTVAMMVIWFFLCLGNAISNIANMAHAAGLGLGLIWGFLASIPAMRGRR